MNEEYVGLARVLLAEMNIQHFTSSTRLMPGKLLEQKLLLNRERDSQRRVRLWNIK